MRRLLLFILFIAPSLFAQEKPYYYSVKTNLYDHKITAIEQDEHGRLILATDKGLFSYNGFQSKQIPTQKLYSKEITQLVKMGNQLIGLTKSGQLFSFQNNQITVLPTSDIKASIVKLFRKDENELLVACANAVYTYQLNPFTFVRKVAVPFYEKGHAELIDVNETEGETFGLLSSNELVQFSEDLAMTIPTIKGRYLLKHDERLLVLPSKPTIHSIFEFQNKRFKNRSKVSRGINHNIHQAVMLHDQLALLSETGLMLVNPINLKLRSLLVGFHLTSIYQDANQTIWIGTASKGLLCIPSGSFKLLSPKEYRSLDFSLNQQNLYAENALGTKVFLNQNGQVSKQPTLEEISEKAKFFNTTFYFPLVLGDEVVKKMIALEGNRFLVASSYGIYVIEAKNLKELKTKLHQVSLRTVLAESPVKDCLFSTDGEMLFSSVDGLHLVSLKDLNHRMVTFFNESIDASQLLVHDQKWVVLTPNSRVFVIQNGKVIQDVNFKENGNNILVSKLKIIGNYFYILSDKALYRTTSITGKLERLNELSSLTDLLIRDFTVQENHVFLATQVGLFRFDWKNTQSRFPVLLVGAPEGDFKLEGVAVFQPANSRISIPYEMVDLMGNHPYLIQFRLIRNDKSEKETWKAVSYNLSALDFEHLRSGKYCLEIRMVDPGTSSVSVTMKTHFEVEASWFEDVIVWFIAGIILGFFVFLYWRGRRRLRRLKRLLK